MYIFFSRVLSFLSSPWSYILTLLVIAVFCKKRQYKLSLFVSAMLLLLVFTNKPFYDCSIKNYTDNIALDADTAVIYDYGIVEGGFAEYDRGRDRIEFSESADRLTDAVILYNKGRIKKIIISGDGSVITRDNIGNPRKMIEFLNYSGIPEEDILIEPNARNTKEHPKEVLKLLGERVKSEKVLVITSAIHLNRSLYVFRKSGINADGYGVDIITSPRPYQWSDWMPDLNLPTEWYWFIHELIGNIIYKFI